MMQTYGLDYKNTSSPTLRFSIEYPVALRKQPKLGCEWHFMLTSAKMLLTIVMLIAPNAPYTHENARAVDSPSASQSLMLSWGAGRQLSLVMVRLPLICMVSMAASGVTRW